MLPHERHSALLGQMRCLASLAEWERLSGLCKKEWRKSEPHMRREVSRGLGVYCLSSGTRLRGGSLVKVQVVQGRGNMVQGRGNMVLGLLSGLQAAMHAVGNAGGMPLPPPSPFSWRRLTWLHFYPPLHLHQMGMLAAHAAWHMGHWDAMTTYVDTVDSPDIVASQTAAGAFLRAVLCIRDSEFDAAMVRLCHS